MYYNKNSIGVTIGVIGRMCCIMGNTGGEKEGSHF